MKTVWKYPVELKDYFEVDMPEGAEILSVEMQGTSPCMWALVRANETPTERRLFRLAGTGHPINEQENLKFIGTFFMRGVLVFHLFEII